MMENRRRTLLAARWLVACLLLEACTWGGASQTMPIAPSVAPVPDGMTVARGREGEVHVKRLSGEGETVWDASVRNGSTRCELVRDDTGGVIVGWNQADGLHLQRISSDGRLMWEDGGVAASDVAGVQVFAGILPDDSGGIVTVWSHDQEIRAQKVDESGSRLWKANSVLVGRASELERAMAVQDRQGGAVVIWQSSGAPGTLHAQHVDSQGNLLWQEDGIPISEQVTSGLGGAPEVVNDGEGGAVVAWGAPDGLYAERVSPEGQRLWEERDVQLTAASAPAEKRVVRGSEAFLVVWAEAPQPTADPPRGWTVYAEKLGPTGAKLWDEVPVFTSPAPDDNVHTVELVSDGTGGAITTWRVGKSATRGGTIRAQRLDGAGKLRWGQNGVSVYPGTSGYQGFPQLVKLGSGRALVVSLVGPSSDAARVRVQAISTDGELLWSPSGRPVFP